MAYKSREMGASVYLLLFIDPVSDTQNHCRGTRQRRLKPGKHERHRKQETLALDPAENKIHDTTMASAAFSCL